MLSTLLKTYSFSGSYTWLNQLFSVLNPVLYAIMAVVGAAGAIYAIILGVNLAKAEDQSKRDEAKKRLITTLIAVAVTIALVVFFTQLMPIILYAFLGTGAGNITENPNDNDFGYTEKTQAIKLVANVVKAYIGM